MSDRCPDCHHPWKSHEGAYSDAKCRYRISGTLPRSFMRGTCTRRLLMNDQVRMVTPDEVLRNCVEGGAKFIPGATEGQVREVANRVVKWLGQAGYEVVRRAD